MRESVVVGVPIDSYGTPGGTELAPATLRELGIVDYHVDLDDAQRTSGSRVVELVSRILAPGD